VVLELGPGHLLAAAHHGEEAGHLNNSTKARAIYKKGIIYRTGTILPEL
jgi:hypothetical protein